MFEIIFLVTFILFLPGFGLTFVFFKTKDIDIVERIALSFALSIAVVPLMVFYNNLMGIRIEKVMIIYQLLILYSGILIAILVKYLLTKHKSEK